MAWTSWAAAGMIALGSLRAAGQGPVIIDFEPSGQLHVSDLASGTWVRVEWAPAPTGGWHRTWQGLIGLRPDAEGNLSVHVPLVYRVVAAPDPPPPGMDLVDAGPFLMGNVDTNEVAAWWYARETPSHTVPVDAFYMDRYETSNEQMRQVMQWAFDQGWLLADAAGVTNAIGQAQPLLRLDESSAELSFADGTFSVPAGREAFPCVWVTWYGAMAYCHYRSLAEGLDSGIDLTDWSCSFDGNGYRLPTEAEWEKAARGGRDGNHFPWPSHGDTYSNVVTGAHANFQHSGDPYSEGSTPIAYYNGSQAPVGTDMANGYGLYDMAGNVYEWCWDRYAGTWYSRPEAGRPNPTGPASGTPRVLRGGAWYRSPEFLRCSFRHFSNPDFSYFAFGFRTVRPAR